MNWKESFEFIKILTSKEKVRYEILITQYLDRSLDGHDAHLCACDQLEKERKTIMDGK